jgi:4-hydroxy-3-methylbut-2-enyl diphosphate reductase IspH
MEKRAFLIEHAGELKAIEAELAPFSRIGLAAGASTPLETTLAIEAALTLPPLGGLYRAAAV